MARRATTVLVLCRAGSRNVPLGLCCYCWYVFGYLSVAETIGIMGDTLVQGLGNPLPVIGSLQQGLFSRVADEADLAKHRRHLRADQHHERCLLNTTISRRRNITQSVGLHGSLEIAREFLRLLDLVMQRNTLNQVAQLEHGLVRTCILTGGHVQGVR